MTMADERHERRTHASHHLLFGAILILAGSLFLLDNLGIAPTREIMRHGWPLILIAIGGFRLIEAESTEGRIGAVLWLFFGFTFLLAGFGYLRFNVWELIWPVALITFGVLMVMKSRYGAGIPAETPSRIGSMAFMGGVERKIKSGEFEGGELTAVMGGCKVDLRPSDIKGATAVLKVFVMMGGIELFVPEGWKVLSKVIPVMGGFVDHTNPSAPHSKELLIDGFVLMGGIEVKNF